MKRSKENVQYYQDRIDRLFKEYPEYESVEKRYEALKLLLQGTYPWLKDNVSIPMLKDCIYLDRLIRKETEGQEDELKQTLSEEKKSELGY